MIFLSKSRTSPIPFLSCPYYIKPYVIPVKFPDLYQKNPDIQTLYSTHQTYNPAKHPVTSEQFDQWQAIQWRLIRLNPCCDKLLPKTIAPRRCPLTVGRWKKKTETESEGQKFRPGRLTECHDGDSAGSMKNERATVSGIIVPGPGALSSRGAIIVGEFILRLMALTDVTNLSVALNPRPRA